MKVLVALSLVCTLRSFSSRTVCNSTSKKSTENRAAEAINSSLASVEIGILQARFNVDEEEEEDEEDEEEEDEEDEEDEEGGNTDRVLLLVHTTRPADTHVYPCSADSWHISPSLSPSPLRHSRV
eukprot:CAMPEP_0175179492 /NCGR_PEP_ID=MMETSP0087-20121206/35532_1 /TAXON_ID=136419 /ORGANISM="Unknown Unknown, Strain D1" /LENGTH=124 /DNA_ID=CAMNT_0016471707 /DNA_START=623 /DNA_END=997 /DNA_ORIENTATION=-